jgi:phosphatidylserine/phosphatidylglycerophosphate/cardiolipin synthase-like enzyme
VRAITLVFCAILATYPVLPGRPGSGPVPPERGESVHAASSLFLPLVQNEAIPDPPPLLVSALYYDGYLTDEPDEAFRIYNPSRASIPLAGWRVSDGTREAVFPDGTILGPGASLWCARDASAFRMVFGHPADCEYAADSDPWVPNLSGGALRFANTGGRILLEGPDGGYLDELVYEGGAPAGDWQGPEVQPYRPTTAFAAEGQILYRKLRHQNGLPYPDTDTRADWAADPDDVHEGRRALFPGWDLERLFTPVTCVADSRLEVIVAPDHSHAALQALLSSAQSSIRFEGYSFESPSLAETIAARAAAGVRVEIMLEGAPPGGVTDAQRWAVQRIATAGGQVYYLRNDAATQIRKRYAYQHGKFWVLDDRLALIGSENPSPESFPADDKTDGTLGRRGVMLATDAPCVVDALREVMALDVAPAEHRDVWAWDAADPALGAAPPGYTPPVEANGTFYPVLKPAPLVEDGAFTFQVLHAPEHPMRTGDGLLGLLARAGAGDTVLIEQLDEPLYWGSSDSDVIADPNPRLEAYLAAARRGARVRVLLDSFFDDLGSPRSNLRTAEYLNAMARAEGLDLEARRANPTGVGLHNKMVLAGIGGQGWVMAGSLNGGEVSAKLNREMNLLVSSDAAYDYLADIFWHDWGHP